MERLNRDFVTDDSAAVRELLEGLQQGDSSALDLLIGMLYEELRVIAHNQRRRWRGDETLGTTALLHEAYAKLRHQKRISVEPFEGDFAIDVWSVALGPPALVEHVTPGTDQGILPRARPGVRTARRPQTVTVWMMRAVWFKGSPLRSERVATAEPVEVPVRRPHCSKTFRIRTSAPPQLAVSAKPHPL